MLTDYIRAAMNHTACEWLPDDSLYYCEIPELAGVWATGADEAAARAELQDVLEEWIALGLTRRDPLPAIDGNEITVAHVA